MIKINKFLYFFRKILSLLICHTENIVESALSYPNFFYLKFLYNDLKDSEIFYYIPSPYSDI